VIDVSSTIDTDDKALPPAHCDIVTFFRYFFIPKLFEKIITCQLQHHCRSIISPCQHGFTRCLSTSTNLLEFTYLITRGFLTHHKTDVIYADFSKAFDSVNHRILIDKLSKFQNN